MRPLPVVVAAERSEPTIFGIIYLSFFSLPHTFLLEEKKGFWVEKYSPPSPLPKAFWRSTFGQAFWRLRFWGIPQLQLNELNSKHSLTLPPLVLMGAGADPYHFIFDVIESRTALFCVFLFAVFFS